MIAVAWDIFINQEQYLGYGRCLDAIIVSTIYYVNSGFAIVSKKYASIV